MTEVPRFLAHLRRDRRGLPIPFVNLLGVEDPDRLALRYDRNVGQVGVFLDDADQVVPDFTRQNMGRQRECWAAGLCQVCGRGVPWAQRVIVLAALSVERIAWRGRQVTVVFEPWMHRRCAEYAVRVCPALIRRTREEALTIVGLPGAQVLELVTSVGWVEGPCEAESRAVMPALWVKAHLVGFPITLLEPGDEQPAMPRQVG